MDTYVIEPTWQRKCQPYVCPIKYPNAKTCFNPLGKTNSGDSDCVPFGYQPKRPNPGGLKFYMYDYPYHTAGGVPLSHPGKGWYAYETTGVYNNQWW